MLLFRNQNGFHHIGLLLAIVVLGAIGFAGWRVYQNNQNSAEIQANKGSITYQRSQPAVIKGILDPGFDYVTKQVTTELSSVKALGTNTVYVYVDYSYKDGQLELTSEGYGNKTFSQIEQGYIDAIKAVKQAGLAVHLAISFGGGNNTGFDVPVEQLFDDAEAVDLKWAKIGEDYQVESFSASSEIDWQMFREYYDTDWADQSKHDAAASASNKYHDRILPKLRKIFKGKLIYQAGLYSAKLCSPGYDYFGEGLNNVGSELSDFPALVKKVFGYAEGNAKCMDSGWLVTELWLPTHFIARSTGQGEPRKTKDGTPLAEIQHEYYKIVFDYYRNYDGEIKPSGLGFTSYLHPNAAVKDRPAEAVIKSFFTSLP